MCVSFYLSTAKLLFVDVSFKANRKKYVLLKNSTKIFQNIPLFKRTTYFYVATGDF